MCNTKIFMSFDTTNNSTRLSYDDSGNYFNLIMSSFQPGVNYKIEFSIEEDNIEQIIDDNFVFKVIK